jgi:hypothetical protein
MTLRVDSPPGAIGRQQLLRTRPLQGYSQPVEIRAPQGALISPVQSGNFSLDYAAPFTVGIQIGYAYRFRISQIPLLENVALYPSVELIDRTYPPAGKKWEYPIPIEVTQEELRMAAAGKMVTRVIYIEDPDAALPVAETPTTPQRYFEAMPGEDPLQVAYSLGRPVAILRLGAAGPSDPQQPSDAFVFGSPPVEVMASTVAQRPALTPPTPSTLATERPSTFLDQANQWDPIPVEPPWSRPAARATHPRERTTERPVPGMPMELR